MRQEAKMENVSPKKRALLVLAKIILLSISFWAKYRGDNFDAIYFVLLILVLTDAYIVHA